MPLGAHLPTSKGFVAAVEHAQRLGCDCLQLFSKSPRGWYAPPLDPDKTADFRAAWAATGHKPLVIHDSYLINLAGPDETARKKSIAAMIDEVERAEALGADFLVTHCGSHLAKDCTAGEALGLRNLAASLVEVLAKTPDVHVRIALENTAAQGTCLGGPFEHLAEVLQTVDSPRLAVCFDTCHAFAAGHDISSAAGIGQVVKEFDKIVGLKHLAVVHLNDSKGELGRNLDRHQHIGEGRIGRDAMRAILTHPKLRHLPFILETPDLELNIGRNLNTVRAFRGDALVGDDLPFSDEAPPVAAPKSSAKRSD
jgi:deoxyribonuclease-4